ncbi:MAG: cupin domain-containing protein [Proteobacteria bacterium]|nr:cupin domain-containing protein [Pseudomonadota bacterium]
MSAGMDRGHCHIDDLDWGVPQGRNWGDMRWKEVFNAERFGSNEFVFGYGELDPGQAQPLHTHRQTETIFVTEGQAKVRLGARSIEVGPDSAAIFPAGMPHFIAVLGNETLRFMATYATEKQGQDVAAIPAGEAAAAKVDFVNGRFTRWAVAEEFDAWIPIEPSKGKKSMCVRLLVGGGTELGKELRGGTCQLPVGAHYTRHFHDQAEIYVGLSGRGIVYVGDEAVEVRPGTAIYLGGRVPHGADTLGDEPFRMYWLYGMESTGESFNWTPVEDTYTEARG